MKPLHESKFKVRGKLWKLQVYTDRDYNELFDSDDSVATTDPEKRELIFPVCGCTIATVRHEVVHILFEYLRLGSTNDMSISDLEEIVAEFVSNEWDEINAISKLVFKRIKGFKT